jgi:histidyl-tRNA synthetase
VITKRPRGTNDILPGETEKWRYMEDLAREICSQYGYQEIRTPVFEHTELFHRGIGETTDIVEKEMYDFKDKGGRGITLRPEGTAPVVRAYLENKLYAEAQPVKLYYLEPMFRYGRPQAGRLRQFHQFGIEVFGSMDPAVDAEVIALAMDYYQRLGLKDLELHINSVGCPQCRSLNRDALLEYLRPYMGSLCDTCVGRLERNPLRIFDCKSEECKKVVAAAPKPFDTLCEKCRQHYLLVLEYLTILNIQYIEDRSLVRGLDYYTNTAFEIMVKDIGAQSSIGGGGRYDSLVEECGGPDIPGIGFGLGLERILLALEGQGEEVKKSQEPKVFVATAGGAPGTGEVKEAIKILALLRQEGFLADKDYLERSLKAQMKYADKKGFKASVIVGGEELSRGHVILRNMKTGVQQELDLEKLLSELRLIVGGSK